MQGRRADSRGDPVLSTYQIGYTRWACDVTAAVHSPAVSTDPSSASQRRCDIAVIGGGVAGLWSAARLAAAGYGVSLFESAALGGHQTLASQGMIHGGIKYTLAGAVTGASEAIAGMPERWRRCLAGDGELDLRRVRVRASNYTLFTADGLRNRLTGFLASRALRGRVRSLTGPERPAVFDGFHGQVYELAELVVDPVSLCAALAEQTGLNIYHGDAQVSRDGSRFALRVNGQVIDADVIIAAAGLGNEQAISTAEIKDLATQRRGLCQLIARSAAKPLPELFGHCITGVTSNEPRLTITTHGAGKDRSWYIGGRIATVGADMADAAFLELARTELRDCLPWLDLADNPLEMLRIDRAEPASRSGARPDRATVIARDNLLLTWPSKLTLAPDLGDQIVDRVATLCEPTGTNDTLPLTEPKLGGQPW